MNAAERIKQKHLQSLKTKYTCLHSFKDCVLNYFSFDATHWLDSEIIPFMEYSYKDWWGLNEDQIYDVIKLLHKEGLRVDQQFDQNTLTKFSVSFDFNYIKYVESEFLQKIHQRRLDLIKIKFNNEFDIDKNVDNIISHLTYISTENNFLPYYKVTQLKSKTTLQMVSLKHISNDVISQIMQKLHSEGFNVNFKINEILVSFTPQFYINHNSDSPNE